MSFFVPITDPRSLIDLTYRNFARWRGIKWRCDACSFVASFLPWDSWLAVQVRPDAFIAAHTVKCTGPVPWVHLVPSTSAVGRRSRCAASHARWIPLPFRDCSFWTRPWTLEPVPNT